LGNVSSRNNLILEQMLKGNNTKGPIQPVGYGSLFGNSSPSKNQGLKPKSILGKRESSPTTM